MSFFSILRQRIDSVNSLLCIGLDPHAAQLREPSAQAAEEFSLRIIEQTKDVAACYKPNSAFFEAFGADGMRALENVIRAIPSDIPVLLDAKRGDISTTAAAYATACFDTLKAHAITLAPYMGRDSIDPFVGQDASRGCFVLCKTSNSSANDVQTLVCSNAGSDSKPRMLYEQVALLCEKWNANDNVGLVVGATDVEAIKRVRDVTPNLWILAPGVGAQGGNLEEAVMAGLSSDGYGMLIPVSRGISKAQDPHKAAVDLRDAINAVRQKKCEQSAASSDVVTTQTNAEKFIELALSCDVLRFGEFTLKSGRKSPYFFNAGLFNTGAALARLGRFYAQAIHDSGVEYDVLFGPAYKGITLVASISIAMWDMFGKDVPYTYNRKEAKDHGEGGLLVGAPVESKRVLIVDDVITAGTAIREAMTILSNAKGIAAGVCISLDRMEKVSASDCQSAIQKVQQEFQIPVVKIASLSDLITFLKHPSMADLRAQHWDNVVKYRQEYGVEQ